jgi:hypothetical protein
MFPQNKCPFHAVLINDSANPTGELTSRDLRNYLQEMVSQLSSFRLNAPKDTYVRTLSKAKLSSYIPLLNNLENYCTRAKYSLSKSAVYDFSGKEVRDSLGHHRLSELGIDIYRALI